MFTCVNTGVSFYPPQKAEEYRFGSVCPGVTNLLGLYLNDYYRVEHETSGCIDLIKEMCTAQEPYPPLPNFRVVALCYFLYWNLMSGRHFELYKKKFKRLLLLNR